MNHTQAHTSRSRSWDDLRHAEEWERSHKRARLWGSPDSLTSGPGACTPRSDYCSYDHECEDCFRTPESGPDLTRSVAPKAVVVKTEPVERWIEIEAQYTDEAAAPSPSSHHLNDLSEQDRATETAASQTGQHASMQDGQLESVVAKTTTLSAGSNILPSGSTRDGASSVAAESPSDAAASPRANSAGKAQSQFMPWPVEWEQALMSYVISTPTLRQWAAGGTAKGTMKLLKPFINSLAPGSESKTLSADSVKKKLGRMREQHHRFDDQLSPAGKFTRISTWTHSGDLCLLSSTESRHLSLWIRRWHDEIQVPLRQNAANIPAPVEEGATSAVLPTSASLSSNLPSPAASGSLAPPSSPVATTSALTSLPALPAQLPLPTSSTSALSSVEQQDGNGITHIASSSNAGAPASSSPALQGARVLGSSMHGQLEQQARELAELRETTTQLRAMSERQNHVIVQQAHLLADQARQFQQLVGRVNKQAETIGSLMQRLESSSAHKQA